MTSVYAVVVMNVVVRRSIIVIKASAIRSIIRDDKVVMHVVPCWDCARGLAVPDLRDVRQPIPLCVVWCGSVLY